MGGVRFLCSELGDRDGSEGGREAEETSETDKETITVMPKMVLGE